MLVLVAIATAAASCGGWTFVQGLRVDIPARPPLPSCSDQPVTEGVVVDTPQGMRLQLSIDAAEALRTWHRQAPACWRSREVLLEAHIAKLEGRLRAIGGAR